MDIDGALDEVKEYLDLIIKKPLSEVSDILSDTVGYWRFKNQINLMLKAKNFLDKKNINPKKISPDILVPILDDGSFKEDSNLSDMFASLLASHLDENTSSTVHPSFSNVLKQLSPLDAQVLVDFHSRKIDVGFVGIREWGQPLNINDITSNFDINDDEAYLSILNLWRLGLLEEMGLEPAPYHGDPAMIIDSLEFQTYRITEYGISFIKSSTYGRAT